MYCNFIFEHGEEYVSPYWPYYNICRPYSMLYIPISGEASFCLNDERQDFLLNHLYIFPANTPLSLIQNDNSNFKLLFIHVFISPEFNNLISYDFSEDYFIQNICKLLHLYVKNPDLIYIKNLTELIVSYIIEKIDMNSNSLAYTIRQYIDKNFIEVFKNYNLPQEFNYSNSHIIKIFKETYNTTPRQYALKLFLQHIMDLLSNFDKPINIISDQLDFSSPANMTKFFKKYTGISPSDYRKKIKNNNFKGNDHEYN